MQRDAQFAAAAFRRAIAARAVQVHVDPRGNDLDAGGVGVVMLGEVVLFLVRVDHHDVGVVGDLLFADAARLRLRRIAVGEVQVLHRGQRVGGVHQRHAPQIPQQPPDLPRQPVVGMHHAVAQTMAPGEGEHPAGERRQLGGQLGLVQALVRPGDDVDDAQIRRHLHDLALARARGTGVHVHCHSAGRQFPARAQHVDVHPAGIAGARLLQRRGVHGDDRDPLGPVRASRIDVAVHGSRMPVVKRGPQTFFTPRARPRSPGCTRGAMHPNEIRNTRRRGARSGAVAGQPRRTTAWIWK